MAPRHAGFALVSGTTETLANNLIEAAFNSVAPLSFRLPSPIAVGGRNIAIAGDVAIMPPHVSFRRRADNLVAVQCRFVAELRLEGATDDPVDVLIDLRAGVLVGIAAPIVSDRFQVGLDLSQASVQSVDISVIEGFLGSAYGAALRSGPVLAALTQALRSIPPRLVRVTVDGVRTTTTIAPKQMPCGASLFELPEMFNASFTVSRIAPKVLDGELTIGVDIAGHSQGDPAMLGTVFDDSAALVWVRENAGAWRAASIRRRGNIGVSVNPAAILSMINGTLNAATSNTFLDCHVALDRVNLALGDFTPNLTTNRIDGAKVTIGASYYPSPDRDAQSRLTPAGVSAGAEANFKVGVHLQTWDGDTAFLSRHADYWFIKVYDLDIDLPWWVTFGLVLLAVVRPIFLLPVVTLLDGIIPALLGNLAGGMQRTLQTGIDKAVAETGLSAVRVTTTLPGLPGVPATMVTRLVAFGSEGFDSYVECTLDNQKDVRPDRTLTVTANGARVREGEGVSCGVNDLKPVPCTLRINPGVAPQGDPTIRVRWEVRRSDTGELVVDKDRRLFGDLRLGGIGAVDDPMRIVIDRSDPALMPVDLFTVYVRVYRPLYGRVKEFGSCRFSVKVHDRFDRHRPYVKWFGWAQGGPRESAIHRTAVPGRCSMLMRAAYDADFKYIDELPFAVEEIDAHRDGLCDYCFFGGPDKTTPLI